jgi:hypothetical protein
MRTTAAMSRSKIRLLIVLFVLGVGLVPARGDSRKDQKMLDEAKSLYNQAKQSKAKGFDLDAIKNFTKAAEMGYGFTAPVPSASGTDRRFPRSRRQRHRTKF